MTSVPRSCKPGLPCFSTLVSTCEQQLLFKSEHLKLRQSATALGSSWAWAARCNTWLLIKLTPKGTVCSFLFFSFLFFSFLFFSVLFCSVLFCSVLFCFVLLLSCLFFLVLSPSCAQAFLLKTTATRCTQPVNYTTGTITDSHANTNMLFRPRKGCTSNSPRLTSCPSRSALLAGDVCLASPHSSCRNLTRSFHPSACTVSKT